MLEAERTQIVHAEDVIGVGVSVENGVDVVDVLAQCLPAEILPGIDDDRMLTPLYGDGGAAARIAGVNRGADGAIAAEGGYTHRSAASENDDFRLHAQGLALVFPLRWLSGLLCDSVRDFEEHHARFEERVLEQSLLFFREIAFGLFLQNAEHVDALARTEKIDAG